jgi:hypothetical protein
MSFFVCISFIIIPQHHLPTITYLLSLQSTMLCGYCVFPCVDCQTLTICVSLTVLIDGADDLSLHDWAYSLSQQNRLFAQGT